MSGSSKDWIAVDLDGTLFTYDKWVAWNVFGAPIEPMIARVRSWLAAGREVRIFTARVSPRTGERCLVTGVELTAEMMTNAIQDHLERHGLPRLAVTCQKDSYMVELWDDRCVQVVPNTGRTLAEEHAAELSALGGKVWSPGTVEEDSVDELSLSDETGGAGADERVQAAEAKIERLLLTAERLLKAAHLIIKEHIDAAVYTHGALMHLKARMMGDPRLKKYVKSLDDIVNKLVTR